MFVLETDRLRLRHLSPEGDAAFMLRLLNDASFIRNIGDRGVRSEEDATRYVADGPAASYARHGFGLYLVELREDARPLGICGLVQRDYLDDPDIGFAFLPEHGRRGYGFESAAAVKAHAFTELRVHRLLAITSMDNEPSIRLLGRIGLRFDRMISPPGRAEVLRLFTTDPA
jgi:RimJ/RimL family protein N-acetyltransferase